MHIIKTIHPLLYTFMFILLEDYRTVLISSPSSCRKLHSGWIQHQRYCFQKQTMHAFINNDIFKTKGNGKCLFLFLPIILLSLSNCLNIVSLCSFVKPIFIIESINSFEYLLRLNFDFGDKYLLNFKGKSGPHDRNNAYSDLLSTSLTILKV